MACVRLTFLRPCGTSMTLPHRQLSPQSVLDMWREHVRQVVLDSVPEVCMCMQCSLVWCGLVRRSVGWGEVEWLLVMRREKPCTCLHVGVWWEVNRMTAITWNTWRRNQRNRRFDVVRVNSSFEFPVLEAMI